jgi:hypothetical protein
MPARAILARFQSIDERPDWASYIKTSSRQTKASAGKLLASSVGNGTLTFAAQKTAQHSRLTLPPLSQPNRHHQASSVRGQIWELSQDAQGSRDVQNILEQCSGAELEELAFEFRDHVLDAARCPHANFVLMKCIGRQSPKASSAFARELISFGPDAILQAAKHRYGCRIIERLIEFCSVDDVYQLVESMMLDAKNLCMHPYGNYTIQHALVHGSEHHRCRLTALLEKEAVDMVANFHASAVIGEALRSSRDRDATTLARTIFQESGLLAQMARTKHGHTAARLVMQVLEAAKDSDTNEESEI